MYRSWMTEARQSLVLVVHVAGMPEQTPLPWMTPRDPGAAFHLQLAKRHAAPFATLLGLSCLLGVDGWELDEERHLPRLLRTCLLC